VQTQEERVNLVFAVEITLDNADHRLKPGMPADAEILLTSKVSIVAAPSPTVLVAPTPTQVKVTPTVKPTPTSGPPTPVDQAEVIAWSLNVRSGPGVDQPIIASLSQGDTVPILDTDTKTGWLQVQLPGEKKTGWITGSSTNVVVITGGKSRAGSAGVTPAPAITATPVSTEAGQSMQVEIVSAGLNVRSGPGTDYPIVATLLKGYAVSVTKVDPTTGWLQVPLPGGEQAGWISGDPAYVVVK